MTSNSYTIFVVDDDDWYRKLLVYTLELNPDFNVKAFEDGASLLEGIKKEKPQVLTLDYRLPDTNGEELLKKVLSVSPNTKAIVISDQSEIETAVNLLKIGAFDYITKTKDIKERLHNVIRHIRERSDLEDRIEELQTEVQEKYDFQNSIIGQSEPLKRVFHLIKKATTTNISVIINGETGTGKEVVAKAIHYNSNRKDNAFVAVNMSAIPKELAESELFGHEKGAFTGAVSTRIGRFEVADKGSIFLDEIGDMPLLLQVKLLRVLQNREIERVGSTSPIPINVRIITATHRDLEKSVSDGNFREDLFYRLNVIPVRLPALKERREDIPLLISYFLSRFVSADGRNAIKFNDQVLEILMSYEWPGNVRELENLIERLVILKGGGTIEVEDLPPKVLALTNHKLIQFEEVVSLPDEGLNLKGFLNQVEESLIKQALERTSGNKNQASKLLQMNRTTLIEKMKKRNLSEFGMTQ